MSSEVVCRNVRLKLCDCFAECCLKTRDIIRLNHFLEVVGTSITNLARKALNISDLREMARRRLTRGLFDFCDKGSEDQVGMRDNRVALDRIKLMPRILRDVSPRDPGITLFGKCHDLPLLIGPTGPAGFVWYRGETALARAAAAANIPFTLASNSNRDMEEVITVTSAPPKSKASEALRRVSRVA